MSSIHHHDYQHQFYYSLKLNKYLDFFFLENPVESETSFSHHLFTEKWPFILPWDEKHEM